MVQDQVTDCRYTMCGGGRDDALILVDGLDRPMGEASKMRAHVEGLLHRAFSVVLTREHCGLPQVLLAQRAEGKYHSGGLWANSCCSHPRVGEDVIDAAYRRVREELGCQARSLREIDAFVYRATFAGGLCEHEYDHVLIGQIEGDPRPDPTEVGALRWVDVDALAKELAHEPQKFAAWAPMVLSIAMSRIT